MLAELKGPESVAEDSPKTPKQAWSKTERIPGENKRERKARQSLLKAQRNEEKHSVTLAETSADDVAKIIHGPAFDTNGRSGMPNAGEAAMFDAMYERMDTFVQKMDEHQNSLRARARARRHRKGYRRGTISYTHNEELAISMLFEMGVVDLEADSVVPVIPSNNQMTRTKRAALIQKLQAAIETDLAGHRNELRDRNVRMLAYWRFVNISVLTRLRKAAALVDRVTGARIVGGDEDDEDDEDGDQVEAAEDVGGDHAAAGYPQGDDEAVADNNGEDEADIDG